jgi:uncharacterized protein (DUF433 family)
VSNAPDRTSWDGVIVTDAETCMGKVRIAGTRHYIDHLLASIEQGASFGDLLTDYPDITRAQLQAMIGFTRDLVAAKRNRLKGELKHD